jgi:hypothetical protein
LVPASPGSLTATASADPSPGADKQHTDPLTGDPPLLPFLLGHGKFGLD